ncbi:MAG: flagellar filament capping protein FliD [Bacteriovoracaceae bacterium]|nr:flagellar filament capping protein FliD [Bacteriovoracaceae bacterium]
MGIAFGPINSGLPKDIVQQLMAAERAPIQKMEARKANIQAKKELVNELNRLTTEVRDIVASNNNRIGFSELKVLTNDDLAKVSVDKNVAVPGVHTMEIVKLAQKSSAMSVGLADKDKTYLGVGYFQYELPSGETRKIYVDRDHATLTGLATLINQNQQLGLRASIINDGTGSKTPWRLIVTMEETGEENKIHFPKFYLVDGEEDFYLDQEREAHNGVIKVDGFEIQVPGNTVTNVIPGATIELQKAAPGQEFSITISEDQAQITDKVKNIYDKVNNVLRFIRDQNNLDETVDTTKTLGGDILLQNIESQIRGAMFQEIQTDYGKHRISEIGVNFQKDGLLKFDTDKFNRLANENYRMVSQIFTGTYDENNHKIQGHLDHLAEVLNRILRFPDGMLASRRRNLDSNINQIDQQIANRQRHLEQKEAMLKDKFARLEQTISQLQAQNIGANALAANAPKLIPQ